MSLLLSFCLLIEEYLHMTAKYPVWQFKSVRSHFMKYMHRYFVVHTALRDRTGKLCYNRWLFNRPIPLLWHPICLVCTSFRSLTIISISPNHFSIPINTCNYLSTLPPKLPPSNIAHLLTYLFLRLPYLFWAVPFSSYRVGVAHSVGDLLLICQVSFWLISVLSLSSFSSVRLLRRLCIQMAISHTLVSIYVPTE